jgi:hypothetical protein
LHSLPLAFGRDGVTAFVRMGHVGRVTQIKFRNQQKMNPTIQVPMCALPVLPGHVST